MDIDYLLALQNIRTALPNAIEQGMLGVSFLADGPALVALSLIVYWCIDKHAGQLACCAFALGSFVCQFLKNLLCVYRPWIRDERIIPAPGAIEGAGGYSFPSGHATGAGSVFGALAWSAWSARTAHKWISVVCVVCLLVAAFSRNFLGVHTPQDVLVGLGIAALSVVCATCFFKWIERCDAAKPGHNKDIAAVLVVCLVSAISLIVLAVKPYPLDYVEGVLLVDPEHMLKGSYEAVGAFVGMALGWLLERRFVGFSTSGLRGAQRAARFVVGVALVGFTYIGGGLVFELILPYRIAKLTTMLALCVVALYVVPLIFQQSEALFGGDVVASTPQHARRRNG